MEGAQPTILASRSSEDTVDIGRRIGRSLAPGSVVGLEGPLGAGKTTLVKGIAQALGVLEEVTSPSFTLISEYRGCVGEVRFVLYHVDLYRIGHPMELEDLGLDEFLAGPGVTIIEWSEKAAAFLPEDSIRVSITLGAEGERRLAVTGVTL
jgi:tRNA threonylcarbamoyladenosine biosynthesis protein TsaE